MIPGRSVIRTLGGVVGLVLGIAGLSAWGAEPASQELSHKDARISMRLSPRAPDQIAAFYEARGLPKPAVDALRQACFITVGIRNPGKHMLWLEPARWNITSPAGPVQRLDQDYWRAEWQRLDVPAPSRATFRWTLLPESRDLHPMEPVGGNLVLKRSDLPITIEARFVLGADRSGGIHTVTFTEVRCAGESTSH